MLKKLNQNVTFIILFISIIFATVGCSNNTSTVSKNTNTEDNALLTTYLNNSDYEKANKLLDKGINIEDNNILSYATSGTEISDSQKLVISKLVEKGAKISLKDINWAIRNNEEMAQLLINKTPNINNLDGMSTTSLNPIYTAIYNNKANIVRSLIAKGVNPNIKFSEPTVDSHYIYYDIMLQLSVSNGNIEIVDMLLSKNPDINYKNNDGETLIAIAALRGDQEMYDYLLKKGANPNIKNKLNTSAKDIMNNRLKNQNPSLPDIIEENPKIGMTSQQVRNSTWGNPQRINKTTTKYGINEQWVYSSYRYIYFDDGIVTAIQE